MSHKKVMPQFGASLTYDSRVVIYDRNMFIIQATGMVKGYFIAVTLDHVTRGEMSAGG